MKSIDRDYENVVKGEIPNNRRGTIIDIRKVTVHPFDEGWEKVVATTTRKSIEQIKEMDEKDKDMYT